MVMSFTDAIVGLAFKHNAYNIRIITGSKGRKVTLLHCLLVIFLTSGIPCTGQFFEKEK